MIGAPPGYVGYDEGGQLTEAVRRKPYSVILLDEIEKAHPDVFNILLQVLDDGMLTDNKGRTANFKNAIIIMTSNMGSHIIQEKFMNSHQSDLEKLTESAKSEVMALLKKSVRPEFLNRIDEVIMFKPLDEKEIKEIVKLQLDSVGKKLKSNGIKLEISEAAINALTKMGYEPEFGARPLKRIIQKMVINYLSKEILAGRVTANQTIYLDIQGDDNFIFKNK